jgi:hypothetical protein
MKKYLLAILVIILLSGGVVVGLILVKQNQIFKQKAAKPTGTASVSIQPATSTFQRNTPYTVSVYFNAANISISGISVRLTYSNLGITASGIQIDPNLLQSGDWTCPVKTTTSTGSTGQVDMSCINTSTAGYTNNANTLLATFTLTADQVPVQNPVIVSFDPQNSIITQKSDGSDILLTPASTGSYTIVDSIAQSPTPEPTINIASPTPTPTAAPTLAPGATASPTPVLTATATPTSTAYAYATATPTSTASAVGATAGPTNPPIPVTGFDTPTIIGAGAGAILLLFGALALIF